MPADEYDDGFDSAESFERADADGPGDGEPEETIDLLVRIRPAENGEFMRSADDVKAELYSFFNAMARGGESLGYSVEILQVRPAQD
jgi:hypothetical protein